MAVKTFTYDGDPTTSDVNLVRYYVGDTDRDIAEVDDKEIASAIADNTNLKLAAAEILDMLSTKYARKSNVTVGQVSKAMGDISEKLDKRAEKLRTEAGKLAEPFFGGLTQAGKDTLNANPDDLKPRFTRGQFDNPEAGQMDGTDPTEV